MARRAPTLIAGELFGGFDVPLDSNDTDVVFAALTARGADVVGVLSRLRGPWAIVFHQVRRRKHRRTGAGETLLPCIDALLLFSHWALRAVCRRRRRRCGSAEM